MKTTETFDPRAFAQAWVGGRWTDYARTHKLPTLSQAAKALNLMGYNTPTHRAMVTPQGLVSLCRSRQESHRQ